MSTPQGFATITPYFTVPDADAFCRFLVDGLGGTELGRHHDGARIANAMVRLGNCTVMLADPQPGYPARPGNYYVYVADADAGMARALAAGAELVQAVSDQPYGDRQGGVRDPSGNIWWISQRLTDAPYYP